MRIFWVLMLSWPFIGCNKVPDTDAQMELSSAKNTIERFYALPAAAKDSVETGSLASARSQAEELLALAERFKGNWNYGNAVHDSNMVLGRVALKEGRLEDAKQHLTSAGKTSGSPQLDSFGPNVSLARDLLLVGEREVVIEYFQLCRRFWELHNGNLDAWEAQVRNKVVPDFGANLGY